MNLALFDIDGTLTDTNQVDAACYLKAMEMAFGLGGIDHDWSHYTFSSDPGIMNQVFQNRLGRLPDKDDVAAFQRRFLALLKEEWRKDPGLFVEIKGAAALLEALSASPDWCAALATGGWGVTAKFKLEAAGLPFNGLPFSCGDDAVSREGIMRVAMAQAADASRVESFAKIVSLGDGVWDVKAARAMNLAFIGVGDQAKLKAAGARAVVPDFSDTAACLALLEKASGLTPEP